MTRAWCCTSARTSSCVAALTIGHLFQSKDENWTCVWLTELKDCLWLFEELDKEQSNKVSPVSCPYCARPAWTDCPQLLTVWWSPTAGETGPPAQVIPLPPSPPWPLLARPRLAMIDWGVKCHASPRSWMKHRRGWQRGRRSQKSRVYLGVGDVWHFIKHFMKYFLCDNFDIILAITVYSQFLNLTGRGVPKQWIKNPLNWGIVWTHLTLI